MEEFEEELLQVAGRSKGAKKRSRPHRAADSEDEEPSSQEEEEMELSNSDDERRPHKSKRGRKQTQEEEDEDDDDEDGYGSDLYIDEEDRRKLEAMTELEREMILAERAEERDKIRQRKALLKSAKQVGFHHACPCKACKALHASCWTQLQCVLGLHSCWCVCRQSHVAHKGKAAGRRRLPQKRIQPSNASRQHASDRRRCGSSTAALNCCTGWGMLGAGRIT